MGNGELASLAYGSLKELHKIEELLLREEIVSRTLGPLFCLGSAPSVPCISVFPAAGARF